jgi:hypothetical protein
VRRPLAEEFFLATCNPAGGHWLNLRHLRMALASPLLAELTLAGTIVVVSGSPGAPPQIDMGSRPPADDTASRIFENLQARPVVNTPGKAPPGR